ncbi:MAG TPA: transcription termination/antitermination protein NusA [Fusobacteria bacterium]|nr:transcription termination/antitermination protein NusA [Fusobacteriota bacterium]|tara:strand:+ start:1190 stop:2230 length:1041 start_codon:yes stop_codon:yes gene_type:complete
MYIKDLDSFRESLEFLEKYRGIEKKFIIDSLKEGIASAYSKTYGLDSEIEVDIDDDFRISIYRVKKIVEKVEDAEREISLEDAKKISEDAALEDEIMLEEREDDFRRNAVQNAKQLVIQRIREAEKNNILSKFQDKKNRIAIGIIRRIDHSGNVFIDLDGIETILTTRDQSPTDIYKVGNSVKVYIVDVVTNSKSTRIHVSRRDARFVKELFAFEVPEVSEGIISVKSVARDAGSRTKVAVYSDSEAIDPVGACVGNKSSRIKSITDELNGEKIDIIIWDPDLSKFISNAIKPSEITEITLEDKGEFHVANVKVKEDQLALAIGRKGQNARLAARLTECKINIEVI